jgi:hypothetical protein
MAEDIFHLLDFRRGDARIAAARPVELKERTHVDLSLGKAAEADRHLVDSLPDEVHLARGERLVLAGRVFDELNFQVQPLCRCRRARLGGEPAGANHQSHVPRPLRQRDPHRTIIDIGHR